MVKDTQTVPRQIADELFECVCSFCEIGALHMQKKNSRILNFLSSNIGYVLLALIFMYH